MSTSDEVLDFLARWDETRRAGRPLAVEELCADRPDLAAAVRARIAVLERMRWLDEPDAMDEPVSGSGAGRPPDGELHLLNGIELSLDEFLRRVTDSRILAAEEIAAVEPQLAGGGPCDNAVRLAKALIAAGRLTPYQVRAIAAGRERQLVLGNYVILDRLGQGGMGQVHKARHRRMDRLVAIKMLPEHALDAPEALARFQREVRAAARLSHPHIVTAFDADEHGGAHFLVMELVDGLNLAELVHRQGPLGVDEALECVRQAGEGLAYAHAQGIVHRDIKPANLLLDRQGAVRVLDMGLARVYRTELEPADDDPLTAQGLVIGTVDFMSPEQAQNTQSADVRSDVYSLGCTLFHLLTGRPPYAGGTLLARMLAHRDAPIPSLRQVRPDVPARLEEVLRRALAKDPAERFQDVPSFLEPLELCRSRPDHSEARSRLAARMADGDSRLSAVRGARDTSSIYSADTLGRPAGQSSAPGTAPPAPIPRRRGIRRLWLAAAGAAAVAAVLIVAPHFGLRHDPDVPTARIREAAAAGSPAATQNPRRRAAATPQDREVAEWALSIGARVEVFIGGSYRELDGPAVLPEGPIRLQAIDMTDGVQATDADLARLRGLQSLITLGCYSTAISDEAGPYLAALPTVEQLSLGKTRVTDAILPALARLSRLRHLRLGETAITDAALDHLARFPALQSLDLSSTQVSAAAVERLSRRLPHCRIVSNHGVIEGDTSRLPPGEARDRTTGEGRDAAHH